jgi:hypothetical protein
MPGPDIWGPPGWKFIHYVTMGYPTYPSEEIKKKYYNYFHALKHVIPCSVCASHFTQNLETLPLTDEVLSNRNNLMKWGIDMHNLVNKITNKKEYSYDEAMLLILSGFGDDNKQNMFQPNMYQKPEIKIVEKFVETTNIYPLLTAVFIIIILLVIIFYLIKKNKK